MDTQHLNLLRNAMDAYQLRTEALTSNIANMDTPGYQRIGVSFEEHLQEVRTTVSGPRDAQFVTARVEIEDGPPILEDEMMDLADTQMRHRLGSRALQEHFALLRTGILGRAG